MIHNSPVRNGNFTSSEIVKLTKLDKAGKNFGEPAIRYIMETNDERMLEQSIDMEIDAKPFSWGKLCEPIVHEQLGLDYTFCSDITDIHPAIPYWVGSKDGTHENPNSYLRAVIDYKAPLTKTSFCALVRPLYQGYEGLEAIKAIRDGYTHEGFVYPKHVDGAKYYCQLVSNAIINKVDYAELIIYMPYQSELITINNLIGDNPQYNWIRYNADAIPFLNDGGTFKNINIIRFKVPQEDKDFLTAQVLKAGKMLIQPSLVNSIAA